MKTPFTAEQFFEVFRNYNESVFPLQLLFYLGSAFIIIETLKPTAKSNKIISGILGIFWLWMGVVYHLIYFSSINKAAYMFGALFILQGILFIAFGVLSNKLSFKFQSGVYSITGLILMAFALVVYPILGYVLGHRYPSSPSFGLPCPTTIFTFGVLLLTDKKIPATILPIPLIWSLIGFTAAFQFGVLEDLGLLIAGLLTTSMLFIRNRKAKETLPLPRVNQ
jgi:hypothetical protein